MKLHRVFLVAALAGIAIGTSAKTATANDIYYQDLFSRLLSEFVLGTPYGPYGPSYDPSYDPYGPGRGGYYEPAGRGYDPYPYGYDQDRYRRSDSRERLDDKYAKAMRRLDRQEYEAREKVYRKYRGNTSHPKYREQMAKISRKYDHKREKVERNTAKEYRKLSGRSERYDRYPYR
jgi:hypothetical protein